MAKGKLGKKQIAGTLLLSSTAIGAATSSATSATNTTTANTLTNFLGNTKDKIGSGLSSAWESTKGAASKLGNAISYGAKTTGNYAVSGVDKAGEVLKSGVHKASDFASSSYNKLGEYAGEAKGKLGAAYNWAKNTKVGEGISKGVDYAKNKIGDAYDWAKNTKVGEGIGKGVGYTKGKIGDAFRWTGNKIGNLKSGVGKLGEKISETDTYKNYISPVASKATDFVSKHAWGIAAILLVSALGYGTYRIVKDKNPEISKAKNSLKEFIRYLEKDKNVNGLDDLIETLKSLLSKIEKVEETIDQKGILKNVQDEIYKITEELKRNTFDSNSKELSKKALSKWEETEGAISNLIRKITVILGEKVNEKAILGYYDQK